MNSDLNWAKGVTFDRRLPEPQKPRKHSAERNEHLCSLQAIKKMDKK